MQIILRSSKTHSVASHPQIIKISSSYQGITKLDHAAKYCPYNTLNKYINIRLQFPIGLKARWEGPLFVFSDGSPICPWHLTLVLKRAFKPCGLDPNLYDTHSQRIGRATDLAKQSVPGQNIKCIGRWKSNSVLDYIRETR